MLNGHLEVDHTRPEMVKEVPYLLFEDNGISLTSQQSIKKQRIQNKRPNCFWNLAVFIKKICTLLTIDPKFTSSVLFLPIGVSLHLGYFLLLTYF